MLAYGKQYIRNWMERVAGNASEKKRWRGLTQGAKLFGIHWASDTHKGVLQFICRILNMCKMKILRKCITKKAERTYQQFTGTDHQYTLLLQPLDSCLKWKRRKTEKMKQRKSSGKHKSLQTVPIFKCYDVKIWGTLSGDESSKRPQLCVG